MRLNDLVGIPWELNGKTTSGTDCIGIIYMYFCWLKGIKDKNPMFKKFYKQRKFHKPDPLYLKRILESYGRKILKNLVLPNDILVFNIEDEIHAGILLPFNKFLHSSPGIGSCIDRLEDEYLRYLEYGVRPYV